ncbi:glutamate racemase [Polaromonas sp.]|uniref:glutamate racemase n=1 Tax=Polaromonas sp. TaxID=1869339 RepID=UPI0013B747F6|nr:glutamate racemase [Polaromonas sp.]NDP64569.1 glutamate racemase [Polaromonas sp.]
MSERGGQSIGVFDSGIGGLSVLKALRADMPREDFIYIADSGHAPYGERTEAHVLARSRAIVQYLVGRNVKALVMACNTATAAAIHWLRAEHPGLALIGVEPALKPAVALSNTGRIGVFATRSTLCSAKFQALLASQSANTTFVLQPCDGLAHAIERSAQTGDTAETIALCARYISAAGLFGTENGQIDTLVLGCTHYPLASDQWRALLGPGVRLIDNGEAVARQTRRRLPAFLRAANAPPGRVSLFTTGDPQPLQSAARRWLNLSAPVDLLFI